MKPAPFDYYAPATVDEAVQLLRDAGDEAKVIAGGQSLVPMLNLRLARFEVLVDIGRIDELRRVEQIGEEVVVGATARQCDIEVDGTVAKSVPLLAAATPLIGHFQIRSRGTVGGSIAHADPAAEYPAVALALDAKLDVAAPSRQRTIDANEFFAGTWMTALEDDEILTAVRFPVWPSGSGFAVEEVARRYGDFAIAGAVVGVHVEDGRVARAAVALFGMGSTPLRAAEAEAALVDSAVDQIDAAAIGTAAVVSTEPPDDLHASSGLRQHIGRTVVTRAVTRALQEAQNR
ncbi:MAG TPA: xanthine dehydrogenase family protein subunit M [Acidimicrobiales bacterium]|nr:xanthine dehydrogenase family protein subunit M [Acidimicrobiales bacterium]